MPDTEKRITVSLRGDPDQKLSIWLFRQVTNTEEIQQKLVAGSLDPELAFIDATLVQDLLIVQVAAQKALAAQSRGLLRTRSLHAELVYNLSGSKHVGQSLQRFGISKDTADIIVASIHAGDPDTAWLQSIVKGEPADLSTLPTLTDTETIRKFYKILPAELEIGTAADAICCRIAASHC